MSCNGYIIVHALTLVFTFCRNESEDIRKVVDYVSNCIRQSRLIHWDHPVGFESCVQDVIQLLNSQQSKDSLLMALWFVGGNDKTTIAKAVYNKTRL